MRSTIRATSETESAEDESDNNKRAANGYESSLHSKNALRKKKRLIITCRMQRNRLHNAHAVTALNESIQKIAPNKNTSLEG
jgi:hypothetical protein